MIRSAGDCDEIRIIAQLRIGFGDDPVFCVERWCVDRVGDGGFVAGVAKRVPCPARDVQDRPDAEGPLFCALQHRSATAQHHDHQVVAIVPVRDFAVANRYDVVAGVFIATEFGDMEGLLGGQWGSFHQFVELDGDPLP